MTRTLAVSPVARPRAVAHRVPVAQLSPTAYEDLRRCPYRFFALRQLALQEPDEIDVELDKSDFGNWLHQVLKEFHESLKLQALPHGAQRSELFDRIATQVAEKKRLAGGEFLPFLATLPALRDGYLAWLEQHEASGAVFESGESERVADVAGTRVFGRLDRIDTAPGGVTWVIDYKTESIDKTKARTKVYGEDTQVAFYAALLGAQAGGGPVRGGYLNIGERGETNLVEQPELAALRDDLLENVARDLARIAAGQALHALGEGNACEYCAARGLCRRDSWEE